MLRRTLTGAALALLVAAPAFAQSLPAVPGQRATGGPPTFSCATHLELIENWEAWHPQPNNSSNNDPQWTKVQPMRADAERYCRLGFREYAMERIAYLREILNMPPNDRAGLDVRQSMAVIHAEGITKAQGQLAGSMDYPFTWPYD